MSKQQKFLLFGKLILLLYEIVAGRNDISFYYCIEIPVGLISSSFSCCRRQTHKISNN